MNDLFSAISENCSAEWKDHPSFAGVSMRTVLASDDTGNMFSAHLVSIAPGCSIGIHDHPENWELHEVAEGAGSCILDGRGIEYTPGTCAVMPKGVQHSVTAGDSGLKLLAKFMPALV